MLTYFLADIFAGFILGTIFIMILPMFKGRRLFRK